MQQRGYCTEHVWSGWVRASIPEETPGHVSIAGRLFALPLELLVDRILKAEALAGRRCVRCEYFDLRWHPPILRSQLLEPWPHEDISWVEQEFQRDD